MDEPNSDSSVSIRIDKELKDIIEDIIKYYEKNFKIKITNKEASKVLVKRIK